ncbi:MAG: hypothetical protein ACO31E_04965, partial [Phycisphaerales bacterium]
MDRKTAVGLLVSSVLFAVAFLVIALSTVISRPGAESQALDGARESLRTAVDAPLPAPAPPAQVKLDTPS